MNRRNFIASSTAATLLAPLSARAVAAGSADRIRMAIWKQRYRFVPTAFGSIAYVESGSGDEVLFLHGFPLSSFQWRGAFEYLDFSNRCIAPDFMGLGATRVRPREDLGAANQARMLIAFLDAIEVGRVHVVANDSGSAVAQLLAVNHPNRVLSLLLTNGDTERQSPPAAMRPVIELSKRGRYADQWLAPWLASPAHARAPDQFGGMCYADPKNPSDEAIKMYFGPLLATRERRRQVEAHAIAQAHNALAGITPALGRCTIPTRIVWGMADTIFDADNAAYLDRAFANSRGVRRLENSKLFWPEERPSVIAEEARALWQTV